MRNLRLLLFAAPLFFGAAFGAFAKPDTAKPVIAAPKQAKRPAPSVAGGPFRDVPPNHWAAQAVETLRGAGIVHGYPGQTSEVQGTRSRTR